MEKGRSIKRLPVSPVGKLPASSLKRRDSELPRREETSVAQESHDYRPRVDVKNGDNYYCAQLDTGATRSYVGAFVVVWRDSNNIERRQPPDINIVVADGRRVPLEALYRIPITVLDRKTVHDFCYMAGMTQDVILGIDFMRSVGMTLYCASRELALADESLAVNIKSEIQCCHDEESQMAPELTDQEDVRLQKF